jgi:putative transposase
MRTDFVLDALEQAPYARQPGRDEALIHHSDRGLQYVSIRYTERLAEAGIEPSVGSRGDSYDNALAETINGLYKAELIHRRAPWKTIEASSWLRSNGFHGSTINACLDLSAIFRRPRLKKTTTDYAVPSKPRRHDYLNQTASTEPGAIRLRTRR